MAVFRGLPVLLSLNIAPDDFIWGVQLSEAARAKICGRTFTVLRVRVVVLSLAATSQQGLRPHFGFSLERVVPLERNVALVVSFVPSLSPCVMAPQEPYVAVGHRLRPPSQIFHRQLPQRRDCLVSVRQNSGFVAMKSPPPIGTLHSMFRCGAMQLLRSDGLCGAWNVDLVLIRHCSTYSRTVRANQLTNTPKVMLSLSLKPLFLH